VFDWNQLSGDVPLGKLHTCFAIMMLILFYIGSGGITLRGDMVESFSAHDWDIPLDGTADDTGSVRVRFKWEPQLLLRTKTQTTFMGITRRMTTKMGTTAFNWSKPPANTTPSSKSNGSLQSKLSGFLDPPK
jgi:hypothetical protein